MARPVRAPASPSAGWLRRAVLRLRSAARRDRTAARDTGEATPRWQQVDPQILAADLSAIVDDPAGALRRWLLRDPAPAMYLHHVPPRDNAVLRRRAGELRAGRFRPHTTIAPRDEALPPAWSRLADSTRTEEMYRHALVWLEPLICVAYADRDEDLWRLVTEVIRSWITTNSRMRPGNELSPGAWHDHAVSQRVRLLCWFLELYRRRGGAPGSGGDGDVDLALVRLVVASIYQHALFLVDDTTHGFRSNHALEAAGSLLAVCITFPELRASAEWSRLAAERVEAYVDQAFASDGFSREQSPRYHLFILRRLVALTSYLDAVGHPVPQGVRRRLDRAARVWPWLVRPDGSLPRIGDTNERPVPRWRRSIEEMGGTPLPAAPSSLPNPRRDTAALLAADGGIYAVLRGRHPDVIDITDAGPADDTHVVFKTDYFRFPHFHHDGLSFVLYALGREWLVDPGPHSYEYDRWERRYLCSSSAHNVVEVGAPFDVHPIEFVEAVRTAAGDRVTARHHLGHAVHTRTLEHRPPRRLHLRDDIQVTDGRRRHIRQLFHVHPDCEVEVAGPRTLRLLAPSGDRCEITQRHAGTWRVVRGQRDPEPLGWYSPRALTIEPAPTCVYEVASAGHVRFATDIVVLPAVAGRASSAVPPRESAPERV